jgi:glycosyltransferase involved in cell wall biosynthesis
MVNNFNILHFSYNDSHGAGNASYALHENFSNLGISSKMIVLHKTRNDNNVLEFKESKFRRLFFKILDRIEDAFFFDKRYNFFDRGRYAVKNINSLEKYIDCNPDVIVLSWISKFICLKTVRELQKKYNSKVYWMFVDMAPMTGGCHFKFECTGFEKKCNNCPAVSRPYKGRVAKNFSKKSKYSKEINLNILYLAPWFKAEIKKSSLYSENNMIYTSLSNLIVSDNIFRSLDKKGIRDKYGISYDRKVILFSATNIIDERKGFNHFIRSINKLNFGKSIDVAIIIIGYNNIDLKKINVNIPIIQFGFISDRKELAEIYNLADVYVSTVLDDIGPATLVFAMLCRIPVVTFDVAIAKDLVIHGKNGYVAKNFSPSSITKGVEYIFGLSDFDFKIMGDNSRLSAISMYSLENNDKEIKSIIKHMIS